MNRIKFGHTFFCLENNIYYEKEYIYVLTFNWKNTNLKSDVETILLGSGELLIVFVEDQRRRN